MRFNYEDIQKTLAESETDSNEASIEKALRSFGYSRFPEAGLDDTGASKLISKIVEIEKNEAMLAPVKKKSEPQIRVQKEKYLTGAETEEERANYLRKLIRIRKDGFLSAIFGGNEKIISTDNLRNYLKQAGFAKDYNETNLFIEKMEERKEMRISSMHHLSFVKVQNRDGKDAYKVGCFIGP